MSREKLHRRLTRGLILLTEAQHVLAEDDECNQAAMAAEAILKSARRHFLDCRDAVRPRRTPTVLPNGVPSC